LNKDYQILLIFSENIPDATCHQTSIQFSTSPNVCFSTTSGKNRAKYALKHTQKVKKNNPNIIDRKLKQDYHILIIFGKNISDTIGY